MNWEVIYANTQQFVATFANNTMHALDVKQREFSQAPLHPFVRLVQYQWHNEAGGLKGIDDENIPIGERTEMGHNLKSQHNIHVIAVDDHHK